jgi:hypothetical protein
MMPLRRFVGPVLTGLLALCAIAQSVRSESWEQRFANPPADSRICKIIHNWPDAPSAQDELIARLGTQGFGGVVCNVSFDQYLKSEAKWQAFIRAVRTARNSGFAMWLYDERGYPSGNAGGLTLQGHPEWEARGLLVVEQTTKGGDVALDAPPGTLVLAGAYPMQDNQINLTNYISLSGFIRDGKLAWTAPAGHWRLLVITEDTLYEGTHAAGNLHEKLPYPNLLLREPTARFVDLTYGSYEQRLGKDLSQFFMGTFTDEPSLMSLFLKRMPYKPLPWAANLPVEFEKRRGYPLDHTLLAALAADAGARGKKVRYDFWLTVGELVSDNYFGQLQAAGRNLRVPSGGHLLAEEGIVGHVPLYGDFFRCIRRLDAPSIDCLTSLPPSVPWYIARLLSSAAELEQRTLVMSETSDHEQQYRPEGDKRPRQTVTEAEIRGTCNRQIVAGVNAITSYYSYSGLSDEQLRRINAWVGRCCTALRGGHQVADIAILYPTESLWTRFVPSRVWTQEAGAAARIESLYRAAAQSLFNHQRDFTFIDSQALLDAKVRSGSLVHNELRWRVLVLPGTDTLPLEAWQKLADFVDNGGVLICLGELPANSEREFPSSRVLKIRQKLWGNPAAAEHPAPIVSSNRRKGAAIYLPQGCEGMLPQVIAKVQAPDVQINVPTTAIRVTHRRVEEHEVYFVINDSTIPWEGKASFAAKGQGEICDPASGAIQPVPQASSVALKLEPYGACILRFPSPQVPARMLPKSGLLPTTSLKAAPVVEPSVGQGEFVRSKITRENAPQNDGPVWRASATLTKGGTDTFLFLQMRYPQALDLSDVQHLEITSWTPENQSTPTQLLVIISEDGGGDFIAETGRSLANPGEERSYIALSRFQLAGWSKDADGVLDLKKVRDIRIGWGGYHGEKDERVEFRVALPQLAIAKE